MLGMFMSKMRSVQPTEALLQLQLCCSSKLLQLWCQLPASNSHSTKSQLEEPQLRSRYKGVMQFGQQWGICLIIPKILLPSCSARKQYRAAGFSSPAEAAAEADVYFLALHGEAVKPQHLNFAAEQYSNEQIAAARQVLQAKYPELIHHDSDKAPKRVLIRSKLVDRSAVRETAAQIASTAGEHAHTTSAFVGVHLLPGRRAYRAMLIADGAKHRVAYVHTSLSTPVEAAVVVDLVRINLYGRQYSVNFPPHTYSDSHMEVVRQDMMHVCPDIFAAAVRAAQKQPPSSYQLTAAATAMEAAVEAASLGALVVQADSVRQYQGVRPHHNSFQARMTFSGSKNKLVSHYATFSSVVKAAVAYDMMRQAVGLPPTNFLASITAAGVPAMKQWMGLNRIRLTEEKKHWVAKAAALNLAGTDAAGNATVEAANSTGRPPLNKNTPVPGRAVVSDDLSRAEIGSHSGRRRRKPRTVARQEGQAAKLVDEQH